MIRDGALVFQTYPQNHVFGVPYQLSSDYHQYIDERKQRQEGGNPALQSNDQWSKRTVKQLKDELRSRGLKLGGNKKDLVARLAAAERQSTNDCEAPSQSEAPQELQLDTIDPSTGKFFNTPWHAQSAEVGTRARSYFP